MKKLFSISIVVVIMIATTLTIWLTVYGVGQVSPDDFSVTLSVSSTTFDEGKSIQANTEFRNLSRRRLRIMQGFSVISYSLTSKCGDIDYTRYWGIPSSVGIYRSLRRNEVYNRTYNSGDLLAPGEYKLTAIASFSHRQSGNIRVMSNYIILTVI